ncbi:MAG: hypothetical protein ABIH92_05660 [Nanoarchaeota archaeon]
MAKKRVPVAVRDRMWRDLEVNLESQMAGRTHGAEMRNAFVNVLGGLFMQPRHLRKGKWINFKPVYVGPYRVNPKNPNETISDACFRVPSEVYSNPDIIAALSQSESLARLAELAESDPALFHGEYYGTEEEPGLITNFTKCGGCSPLLYERGGVIADTARDGQNRYIEDVTKLPEGCHIACDKSTRRGGVPTAEYTIVYWSKPITEANPWAHKKTIGLRGIVWIWDIDLQQTEMPLRTKDMSGLNIILNRWNPRLAEEYTWNGEIAYTPTPDVALKDSRGGIVHVDVAA